jgi:hypothetical protein
MLFPFDGSPRIGPLRVHTMMPSSDLHRLLAIELSSPRALPVPLATCDPPAGVAAGRVARQIT